MWLRRLRSGLSGLLRSLKPTGPSWYYGYPVSRHNNIMANMGYLLPRRLRRGPAETGRRMARQLPPGVLDQVYEARRRELQEDEARHLLASDFDLSQAKVTDDRLTTTLLFAGARLDPPSRRDNPLVDRGQAVHGLRSSPYRERVELSGGFFCRLTSDSTRSQPCWVFPLARTDQVVGCVVINADNGVHMFDLMIVRRP